MDVIILADFLGPLDGTFNSRFLYLADMLARDHTVEIITSDFDHGRKAYFQHEIEKHDYTITMLHEGAYSKNVTLKRFYGHYIWAKSVKRYLKKRKRPDVIYCAVPTLKASYEAAKYCKRNNVRFVIDIQDLWPEAFKMVFNMPIISDLIFLPIKKHADRIYSLADDIVAVSNTYAERGLKVNHHCDKAIVVYLGTEKKYFDRFCNNERGIKSRIKIAYVGSLSYSYDLDLVIDAIDSIKKECDIEFIIMGDGPLKSRFEAHAQNAEIKYKFTGMLPYKKMVELLCSCDIAVNPIRAGSAGSILNKVGDYAMAGLPVINMQECNEYCELLEDYSAGINCSCGDMVSCMEALKMLIRENEIRMTMSLNAKKLGYEKFDRFNAYCKIVELIKEGNCK